MKSFEKKAGAPIASSLDPQGQIQFKLFRESTKFINNNYVKVIITNRAVSFKKICKIILS